MNSQQQLSNSTYADEMHVAERELSAFIGAVTQRFVPEEAKLSVEDWLDESELMDSPPQSTSRDWRAVSVAASARLAKRVAPAQHQRTWIEGPTDTKVSPIPSSNCFSLKLLV